MRQFVLPPSWTGGGRCELTGRDARRLTTVLRLGPGDEFPALGPDGRQYSCSIIESTPGRVVLTVGDAAPSGASGAAPPIAGGAPGVPATGYLSDVRSGKAPGPTAGDLGAEAPAPALPSFVLGVGALKGSKLDDVVRMAVEAGATEVVPLVTARSLQLEAAAGRVERLRRIVVEALSQSGSRRPTSLVDPMTLDAFARAYAPAAAPSAAGARLGIVFHETPLAQATLHRYCSQMPGEIVACVGPEGGFSDDEIALLTERGFQPAWLGPTVLRAETAAIFALASLRIVCLECSSWITIE